MQEKVVYEYAVIRLVPKVEREEFFNIGLILFSKKQNYIQMKFHLCKNKFSIIAPELDYDDILCNLQAFQKIAEGQTEGGPIAQMDAPERFRWLTAVRSSSIQTSRPHPGISDNLEISFERLFEELVK